MSTGRCELPNDLSGAGLLIDLREKVMMLTQAHTLLVERLDREFKQTEVARLTALGTMDRRLEGMNEFRAQIAEAEKKFATRTEMDVMEHKLMAESTRLSERIRATETELAEARSSRLGPEYAEANDLRVRTVERLIYMAAGGLFIIMVVIRFVKL